MTEANIRQIIDASVRDISRRVGKLEAIEIAESMAQRFDSPCTVYVTTNGDFSNVFSFCADRKVLETIARNMMHGAEVSDEDIQVCAMEFFNILCGQAISSINRKYNIKTRFSVPGFQQGESPGAGTRKARSRLSYSYPCGAASFEVY